MSQVRYSSRVAGRARQLAGQGLTPTRIQTVLVVEMGVRPALTTIMRWIDDEYRERRCLEQAVRARARRLYERMVTLRQAGLSYSAIAAVVVVDEGVSLTGEQVRWALRAGRVSRPLARALAA